MLVAVVRRLLSSPAARVPLFVDTGADRTVIPAAFAEAIGFDKSAAPTGSARPPGGSPRPLPLGRFRVEAGGLTMDLTCFVSGEEPGLLGRDFLNATVFKADGPAGTFSLG